MSSPAEKMIADLGVREFIVFAGAGMSAVTGVKKWRELMQELNELAGVKGVDVANIDSLHFPEVAQMIYDRLQDDGRVSEYYEVIKQCMKPTQCSWVATHQKIIRACSSVVTTNIDGVFEKAMKDELEDPPRSVPTGQRFEYQTLGGLNSCNVMKPYHVTYLHGRCDKEEIVLKTRDYFRFYRGRDGGEPSDLEKVLREVFCRREGIVFVGFSFGDRFVLETFEQAFRELQQTAGEGKQGSGVRPEEVRHYVLLDDPVEGGKEREEWLMGNSQRIIEEGKDLRNLTVVERRVKLEKRLRAINVEVIRYKHGVPEEVEGYFEQIYNRRRGVQDFFRK